MMCRFDANWPRNRPIGRRPIGGAAQKMARRRQREKGAPSVRFFFSHTFRTPRVFRYGTRNWFASQKRPKKWNTFFSLFGLLFFLKSNRKLDQTWYQSDIWKWNRVKSVNTENYLGTAWMLSNMIKSSKEKLGKTLWNSVRAAFNPVKRGKTVEETR